MNGLIAIVYVIAFTYISLTSTDALRELLNFHFII